MRTHHRQRRRVAALSLLCLLAAALCSGWLSAAAASGPAAAAPGPTLSISPPVAQPAVGDVFNLTLVLTQDDQSVDGVELHVRFDPTKLQVIGTGALGESISPGTALDVPLGNRADNRLGQIDFIQATLGPDLPRGTFTVADVTFKAIAQTDAAGTTLSFVTTGLRSTTRVTLNGTEQPLSVSDGVVFISATTGGG